MPEINIELAESYHASYSEYAKTLRTWLISYAIGAPVLVVGNDKLGGKLLASGSAPRILELFLAAIGAQVGIAALNKVVMWAVYFAEIKPEQKSRKRFRFAGWLSEQFWIDFLADLVTFALLGLGTYLIAVILLK